MANTDPGVSDKKRKALKKLAKQEKRALRAEADRSRFQNSDRKSLSALNNREAEAVAPLPEPTSATGEVSPASVRADRSSLVSINRQLADHAAVVFALAAGVGLLMVLAYFMLDGGKEAVQGIGGLTPQAVPSQTAQMVFALDTLFPVLFGGGLAILITSAQSRGNRPLIRLALTAVLVAVVADFTENAFVYATMNGAEIAPLQWTATVIKYASLAFVGVLASAVLPVQGMLGQLVHVISRYLFPVSIAVLVSGLAGEIGKQAVGLGFPITLIILSLYAANIGDRD